jgi:hypothetical protein
VQKNFNAEKNFSISRPRSGGACSVSPIGKIAGEKNPFRAHTQDPCRFARTHHTLFVWTYQQNQQPSSSIFLSQQTSEQCFRHNKPVKRTWCGSVLSSTLRSRVRTARFHPAMKSRSTSATRRLARRRPSYLSSLKAVGWALFCKIYVGLAEPLYVPLATLPADAQAGPHTLWTATLGHTTWPKERRGDLGCLFEPTLASSIRGHRDARRRSGLQRSNRATSERCSAKTSTSSMRDATPDRRSRIMSSTCLSTDGRWPVGRRRRGRGAMLGYRHADSRACPLGFTMLV